MRTSLSGSLSGPQRFRFQARSRAGRGFSLIEMIGVLAIMGILAGMLAPPILRQLRQAQVANEDANLEEVARAIVTGIQAEGRIPDPTAAALSRSGWVGVASNYSSLGTNGLLLVFPNNTSTQRRFYLSGDFETWLNSNGFQVPSTGWPADSLPAEAQFVLVSSSREDLTLPTPLNAADFNRLKVWTKSYVGGFIQVPDLSTPFGPSWQPSADPTKDLGQYLHVKTVDLKNLFCLVQLEDMRGPPSVFRLNAGTNYSGYGPLSINTNGVTLAVYFSGITNNDTAISSVGIASAPGRILWNDSGSNNPISTPLTNTIPVFQGANNSGSVNLVFPATPSYATQTNPLLLMTNQDASFYVTKGTSLRLGDANLNPQKTVVIQGNSTFRFFNGSWTRVD